ncbi:phosphoribosyltransferase family protein [Desulforamulus reducens]|nr:phosphoribosyltransferase family protein [Desulforamulus reducens]
MTIQALSTKEKNYKILDNLMVGIRMEENPYSLTIDSIFSMAARNNPKRSFLFVSKLIGKHIPVLPNVPLITGFLLASRLAELWGLSVGKETIRHAVASLSAGVNNEFHPPSYSFPGKALFIGFAETATALGHAVFSSCTGNINFLHTTRENLEGNHDTIYFTEDHCHAPDQRCLICQGSIMKDNDLLVLVDDEITTGNTCLNIIETLQQKYPQKRYVILTILDWRSDEAMAKYRQVEGVLGVKIDVLSLLKGRFWYQGEAPVIPQSPIAPEEGMPCVRSLYKEMGFQVATVLPDGSKVSYLGYTGRFGVGVKETKQALLRAKEIGYELLQVRKGKKTLCLGTGEFMYIPCLIAKYMGEGIMVQSTTRSPVHPYLGTDYAVKYAINFEDPHNPDVKNYIYNIPPNYYDEVFVFWERKVVPEQVKPFVQALHKLGIENIVFVYFTDGAGGVSNRTNC